MRTLLAGWILVALVGQANLAPGQGGCDSPDNETRVRGDKECLVIRTFRSASPSETPKLLVFIHGDVSTGSAADYIYDRAREAVADGPSGGGAATAGLLRQLGQSSTVT